VDQLLNKEVRQQQMLPQQILHLVGVLVKKEQMKRGPIERCHQSFARSSAVRATYVLPESSPPL
jgi:hypothetical protein